jgi:DNA-binding response OmpR family regulator
MAQILIVEDEPLIAMMLADWIIELGRQPIGPARNVSEALALIDTSTIDGAFLDVNLGRERCDAVAERLSTGRIPFILTTGEGSNNSYPDFGHIGTLMKPYDFGALEVAMATLNEVSRAQRPAT